jgi:hypothetical protein
VKLPKSSAARLFLERQHLSRRNQLTPANLEQLVHDTGGLQLDSINVVDRAHYITLFSRFGPYDKEHLDKLVYKDQVLIEYWSHAACMVAAKDLPYWRRAMLDYKIRHTGWSTFLKRNPKILKEVEQAIRDKGPLSSKDFERPKGQKKSAGWWDWKPSAHALQYLWMSGRISVRSRKNFHKLYDLADRVLPPTEPALDYDAFKLWHMKKALHAMGAATDADLGMYLTFPKFPAPERRKTLAALVKQGDVVKLEMEGDDSQWFALAKDVPELQKAAALPKPTGTTLLSPFDSFLWHRQRTRNLFGFDYTIEVYVPGPKRKFGYYSLPILHEGKLIGRLDPKNHRAEKRLEIHAIHFEDSFVKGKDVEAGMAGTADAIRSLAEFLGAKNIKIGKVHPAGLKLRL